MSEAKCRRCHREMATDVDQFESDEDGELCAAHLPLRGESRVEMYGDCMHHKAHRLYLLLSRATTLLSGASMSHVMGAESQRRTADEIQAFLTGAELLELTKW